MYKLSHFLFLISFLSCQDEVPDGMSPMTPVRTGLIKDASIMSNGVERAYHLFVPENHDDQPLVIVLHANRSSHDDIIGDGIGKSPHSIWLRLAEQDEFMVLVPNGTIGGGNKRGWNDCRSDARDNPSADDVSFIKNILSSIKRDYNYNTDQVYAAGTSNGGHMAYRLAQEMPDKITAFASIVSAIPVNAQCTDSSIPVSALFMNGTDDPILPYNGGEMSSNRGAVLSTAESVAYWIERNGTMTTPTTQDIANTNTTDGSTARKYTYAEGSNGTEVVLYEIIDGGHAEPSIQERFSNVFLLLVGNQNGDFETAEEIWNFFKDKSK